MIGTYIYTCLSTTSAITQLVSTRIYPVVIPQTKDLPAIVYSIAGAEPSHSNDGASKLDKFTFNLICVARNYTLVDDMAAKVRAALHAYNTGPVQSIRYQTEMDDFDIETLAYLRVMTFTLRLKL